jgi:EAL domain-containing protein (putative c-di-GMP-specific phosphodiesterase class I)
MLAVLDHPFRVGDIDLDVDGSVGIALFPDHGTDAVVLLQRADIAVYQAKQLRGGWEFYNAERDLNTPRRLTMAVELKTALLDGGLSVHYQPKAELTDGRVTGVEVLARWNHPTDGFIPPDEFIPLAEHTGLIRPLTYWVLAVAINQCGAWRRQGVHLHVAVNLSMRVLVDSDLSSQVETLLADAGLPASSLTLEITESTIMSDPVHSIAVLRRLSDLGITLSIDDFGTGYSSLAYLKRLPVGEVKIDRAFVMGMGTDMADAAIVRSTIDLAHNLGLRVVAEGVEDTDTWDSLALLGCHSAQGYLLSKPMPAPEFERWLTGYMARSSMS